MKSPHLLDLLTAGDGVAGLQLVFVNSCFSKMPGECFADAGVPHVVCLGGNSANQGFLVRRDGRGGGGVGGERRGGEEGGGGSVVGVKEGRDGAGARLMGGAQDGLCLLL